MFQQILDWFWWFRKALLTSVAYISLRLYATEISWRDVWEETFVPAQPDDRNAQAAADIDLILANAEKCTKNAEARRLAITDKAKILLTLSSLLVAAIGILLPKGLVFHAAWMRVVFFISAIALLNAVTLLLIFFGVGKDTVVTIDQNDIASASDDLKRNLINANFQAQTSLDNRTDYVVEVYKVARFFFLSAFTAIVVLFSISFFQQSPEDSVNSVARKLRDDPLFREQVRGDKGDRGDKGERGDKGDRGERGERGEKGESAGKSGRGEKQKPSPPASSRRKPSTETRDSSPH